MLVSIYFHLYILCVVYFCIELNGLINEEIILLVLVAKSPYPPDSMWLKKNHSLLPFLLVSMSCPKLLNIWMYIYIGYWMYMYFMYPIVVILLYLLSCNWRIVQCVSQWWCLPAFFNKHNQDTIFMPKLLIKK